MGHQQSKGELLYQQVSYGNVEGIKALRGDGAGLEWIDREWRTPLVLACMNSQLYDVSKTLIELGANVDAYRPGRLAGTSLHHAAKRGLENTVKLLLSCGANPLVLNDDCQTPLEVARAKGCSSVVRAVESHICLFSGWMRELYCPGFLELPAPQLPSRRVWVVISPTGSRNPSKPFKLELAIYPSLQDAQPRMVVALWKASLDEPKPNQSDTAAIIVDNSTVQRGRWHRQRAFAPLRRPQTVTQTRIKLATANEGDKQQLQWFCDACKGTPQATKTPVFLHDSWPKNVQATAPFSSEGEKKEGGNSSCVICLDARSEAACVPCGHVVGCTSCLNDIKTRKWGCPVCRAKIDQIIKVYRV